MKKIVLPFALLAFLLIGALGANAQYILRMAGNGHPGSTGDGSFARLASLRCPTSVARDSVGNIYIADGGPFAYDNDARIRKISINTGAITTIAGMYHAPDSAVFAAEDIPASNTRLKGCASIIFDKKGDMLIADGVSCVRRIDRITGNITTIAGSKTTAGFGGDNGPATAALLRAPMDVAVDGANNVYIADMNNQVIRKVNAVTGFITTVAGKPNTIGSEGDGYPAILAKLNQPHGVYVDAANNIFIADYNNNKIRKVTFSTGIISTVAGNGPGFSGDGGPATAASLAQPARITMDATNNMYISDVANQRIRRITPAGIISTYVGNGESFYGADSSADMAPATSASIVPYGMCFDRCGNMYVGSVVCNVYAITPILPDFSDTTLFCDIVVVAVQDNKLPATQNISLYPNPNNGEFDVNINSTIEEPVKITVYDITGKQVYETKGTTNTGTKISLHNPPGLYFLNASTNSNNWISKIVLQ